MIANLRGVDMFAKIQDLVAFLLVGSMIIMGLIGMLKLGTGQVVSQPYTMATKPSELFSATATAFWLFIGAEYVIPVSKSVKNAKRNVPLGMIIGLALSVVCVDHGVWIFIIIRHGRSLWIPRLRICFNGENLLGVQVRSG